MKVNQRALRVLCMHRDWLASKGDKYKTELAETEALLNRYGVHIAKFNPDKPTQQLNGSKITKIYYDELGGG